MRGSGSSEAGGTGESIPGSPGTGRLAALPPGAVAGARGPRAVEAALLHDVLAEAGTARAGLLSGEPDALARPIRVVVPSRSLREALCAALAQRAGGALLAVQVQSLDSVAREVLERAGETVASPLLYPVAVREAARREPALARELGGLSDGYAPVVASVDDLLDAGLAPGLAPVVAERLDASDEVGPAARARAEALLRVADRIAAELAAGRLGHRSARLARAAARLADDPGLLPARGVWLHGFADATGVQADLLETLVRRCGARMWVEAPRSATAAPGAGFGARLRERLAGRAEVPVHGATASAPPPAVLVATRHSRPDAEARAAAAWARERIDAGDAPERLGLVARDLGPYRLALRRHLGRLGVPFSGVDEPGAAGPAARRLGALEELLRLRGATAAERWLDALARVRERPGASGAGPSQDAEASAASWREPGALERADWLHALHTLGVVTLADVASLDVARLRDGVRLAARRGLARRDEEAPPHVSRRRVPAAVLARLVAAARSCRDALDRLPDRAPLGVHRSATRQVALRALGWPAEPPAHGVATREAGGRADDVGRALARVLAALDPAESADDAAAQRPVSFEDWMGLLAPRLAAAGRDPLGGLGAGVQVLSVMEARARVFDGLWVLGLNRGLFPRRFSEDPLLPDALRRPLRDVLPDLPLKGAAPEEERFLFAQLLDAAPRVRVSCARQDGGGRQSPASPLLDRVAGLEVADAVASDAEVLSLHDQLQRAARAGPGELAPVLGHALESARGDLGLGPIDAAALVGPRLAVVREIDDPRRRDLGPYLGLVGATRHPLDPRRAPPWVTQLERMARCPWQVFLERIVRLAPPPDALDALPAAADARLLGNVVHAALQRLADPAPAAPAATGWPSEPAAEALLRESARAVLRDEGVALTGYANALARRAAPCVEVARRLALADPGEVVAAEAEHAVTVRDAGGRARALAFKADLVERETHAGSPDAPRRLRVTDYKTGRPPVDARTEGRRRAQHRERLARGELLQAHAYARLGDGLESGPGAGTAAEPSEETVGRYLYLAPEVDDALRVRVARPEDADVFEASVATLLEALDQGGLPPRLRDPARDEEPRACQSCEVKLACLRGDSGTRRRLGAWSEAGSAASPAERAALAVWRLPLAEGA